MRLRGRRQPEFTASRSILDDVTVLYDWRVQGNAIVAWAVSASFEFASHSSSLALRYERCAHATRVRSTCPTGRRRKLVQVPRRNIRPKHADMRLLTALAQRKVGTRGHCSFTT